MNQWLNREHPQTLQGGVILGYISAVFALLGGSGSRFLNPYLSLLLAIALAAGAFLTANNKRIGYMLLLGASAIFALDAAATILLAALEQNDFLPRLALTMWFINRAVFPLTLALLVLHPQSWNYQKVLFS